MKRRDIGAPVLVARFAGALAAFVLVAGAIFSVAAQEFGTFNPGSTARVNHGIWAEFLKSVPIPYERAKKYMATTEWDCRTVRSRIRRCKPLSSLTSAMQGINLLPYRYMKPEIGLYLREYLDRLDNIDPATLNRDEQLAFWLNARNAAVILNLFHAYPLDEVPGLEPGKSGSGDFWTRPVMGIAGRPLSILDIEEDILFEHWKDPLLLYGLFDGSVGSPLLRSEPFFGATVHVALRENGREFVNSPRAMRIRGESVRLAPVFLRGAKMFRSDADLIDHLKSLAEPEVRRELAEVVRIKKDDRYLELAEFSIKGRMPGTNSKDLNELPAGISFEGFYFGPGAGANR